MKQYWLILISTHKSLFKIVITTITGFVFLPGYNLGCIFTLSLIITYCSFCVFLFSHELWASLTEVFSFHRW